MATVDESIRHLLRRAGQRAVELALEECDELFAGQDFLWRVRFALHMITNRREDRLLFDHQLKIARLLGWQPKDAGETSEMLLDLARFRAAFPEAYLQWKARAGRAPAPADQPAT